MSGLPDALAHLEIWAPDAVWAENFLVAAAVREHLARLFPADALPPDIGLILRPGKWTFAQRAALANLPPEGLRRRGVWAAESACCHRQHIGHNLPLSNRTWVVLMADGRARFSGFALACKTCDEGAPPDWS